MDTGAQVRRQAVDAPERLQVSTIKDWISIIFSPRYWVQNYEYSPSWDLEINLLMRKHKFSNRGNCTAMLGPVTVWIENHPYASFTECVTQGGYFISTLPGRPSRLTILRARRKIIEEDVL